MALPIDKQVPSFEASLFQKLNVKLFKFINKYIAWHKLPGLIGAVNIDALRIELRQTNLHDGYATADAQGSPSTHPLKDERYKHARHSDGKYNSLSQPLSGCTGQRFGRNFARKYTPTPTQEELWTPNPRMLSQLFMERKEFLPATTLNLLAAAWIQFQTHDWFKHDVDLSQTLDVPLPDGDNWPHGKMVVHPSRPDVVLHPSDKITPGYKNLNTAWWDGSQIYGQSEEETMALRDTSPDGKLLLTKEKGGQFLPRDVEGNVKTGFRDNWWIGLEILHTLFVLEHNHICDVLRDAYPNMPTSVSSSSPPDICS
jgi:hypothetical protein